MTPLWTAAEAEQATGGHSTAPWAATGVSIDSREVVAGDLFVALKDQRDGHEFVASALASGAAAAVVNRVPDDVPQDAPLLVVPDVLQALSAMARMARARMLGKVIAVTGSAGKTSTKEMLRTVLSRQGKTHAAERSFNNHWGVPLTLARMPADSNFTIVEIGMNHPGEIAPLSFLAQPDIAIVTNVAAAHLEAFDNVAGIAREKAAIISGLNKARGVLIACQDIPEAALQVLEAETSDVHSRIWFGSRADADWRLKKVRQLADCQVVDAQFGDLGEMIFKLSAPGQHFAVNALAALAAVDAAGGDAVVAAHDLALWEPPEGRGKRETIVLDLVHDDQTFDLFDDAFNANPISMAAALSVLAASEPLDDLGRVAHGRRVAVLGDMLELGPQEIDLHRQIANQKAMRILDVVHCVGTRMKHLYDALPQARQGRWFETATEAAAQAHNLVDAGDVLLVKGSKGSKVSLVVDALRKLGHPLGRDEQGG